MADGGKLTERNVLERWTILDCVRGYRGLAVGVWIASALPVMGCHGGGGHEQEQAAGAKATAAVLSMKPLTDWGQVHLEHSAGSTAEDLYTVTFDSAASLPVRIQVSKGVQLKLDDLPPDNTAKPLDPSKYSFELTCSPTIVTRRPSTST